jgi:hypothetical protein
MTPKEQAVELLDKMYSKYNNVRPHTGYSKEQKRIALIAVDEILDVIDRDMNYQNVYSFYLNVKQEIEKL